MQRERLTITLDADLLSAVDATIDGSSIRNRSHALEDLVRTGLSLHLMRQAILLVGENWDSASLPKIITLCDKLGITQYFLVPTPITLPLAQELALSIAQLSGGASTQVVAGDFGSGGALTLLRNQLTHDFLLIELTEWLQLPPNLLDAYTHHRRNGGVLTQIISRESDTSYLATGFSFLQPTVLESIPAGFVSLEETIFPALHKAGKVVGYVR